MKEVEELEIGDIVRVRPRKKIPIDGTVVRGSSTVNESIVTGEPMPVEKKVDEVVVGGSINKAGSIDIKVTKTGEDTFLQQVTKYVEEAKALKPDILVIVDKVLKYYVPAVLLFAAGAFAFWTVGSYLLFGFFNILRGVFASLAVLVMGYPCVLGMAMLLALMRGGGKAAESGILMRWGEAFQAFPKIENIVLDKTGTITKGTPEVTEVKIFDVEKELLLSLAASAEELSDHTIAKAIGSYVDEQNITYQECVREMNEELL